MNLQREIKDKYGFWICKDDQYQNNFTYCRGNFMPCSRRAGGRSICVQECDTKYMIGLWIGHTYVCSNRDDALQVIYLLISGEKRMTDILEVIPAKGIDIHYLLSEEVPSIETLVSTNMMHDKQILLPFDAVKDFLLQSQCEYHMDKGNWITFEYAGDNILFRLSPHFKDGMTLVNIGIETEFHKEMKHSKFLIDFPEYITSSGFTNLASYWRNEYFYNNDNPPPLLMY